MTAQEIKRNTGVIALAHRSIQPGEGHEVGRELLAQLYREHRGQEMPQIIKESRGKPRFAADSLHFSITHTRHHVFCATADHPIGIDAEELDRKLGLQLAERVLSETEKAQYDAAPDKRRALLTFWVLKEADAKRTGEGLKGFPNHTAFSLDDPRVQILEGCLLAVIE